MKLLLATALLCILSIQAAPQKCKAKGNPSKPPKRPSEKPFRKTFAPYTQTWIYSEDSALLKAMDDNVVGTVVAAFAIAQVNGPWAACNSTQTLDPSYKLTWGGDATSTFGSQIKAVQNAGKEVIISFGGWADPVLFPKGREISGLITDVDKLANAYIEFIKEHNAKRIDFDIEEGGLLEDTQVSRRRNDAIVKIIKAIPGIQVSYTLPVNPTGLKTSSISLLADAASKDIPISSVNLMTMNFDIPPNSSATMGELSIQAIESTYKQFQTSNIPFKIGAIPMIGQNDLKNQVFTVEDAKTLKEFVEKTEYVKYLGYWSMERDVPGVLPNTTIDAAGCPVGLAAAKDSGTSALAGAYLDVIRF